MMCHMSLSIILKVMCLLYRMFPCGIRNSHAIGKEGLSYYIPVDNTYSLVILICVISTGKELCIVELQQTGLDKEQQQFGTDLASIFFSTDELSGSESGSDDKGVLSN